MLDKKKLVKWLRAQNVLVRKAERLAARAEYYGEAAEHAAVRSAYDTVLTAIAEGEFNP